MHNLSEGASVAALKSPPIPDTTVLPGIAPQTSAVRSPVHALLRPDIRGKFIFADHEKLFVRGVTYGAFRPDAAGREYQNLAAVERDFAHMAACGLNAVRIPHTMPDRPLLDAARRQGLRVMVGLSAEQYLGFLIDGKKDVAEIAEMVRAKVRTCAGHRALLCYSLGNEIPAPIARWLGRRKLERYLERLYHAVKEEDPGGLVTYVNYPTTEYLQLPFLDFVCFNVYLESKSRFESYLARLQNIAGNRPLMMSELGLDSLRNGEDVQARSLDFQVRAAFAGGCAGAFVFSWTDEWHRHGSLVEDWAFGLTRADRSPKPALQAVREAFAQLPFPRNGCWPRISVLVCTYNGARTIRDCLDALEQLDYPDYEVIVVDDGSTDATAAIAREYDCLLIQTENRGLACARNTGLQTATGEIVAYIDDDAYPDPHWLTYLAFTFLNTPHVAVGGPNLPPSEDGSIAECVAHAPGGPVHVLLTDSEAEHIPGCNMAFRKHCLEEIGGFDPQFRTAGDDVDVCWRLQEKGWTLGFSPAAMVWHHRRNSVLTYWKQQTGYGRAEAMLERKWPQKYNGPGHVRWAGRLYGNGLLHALGWRRPRVYHGIWGAAPYQSLYQPAPTSLGSLPQMPEWYLLIGFLIALSALSLLWSPLGIALLLLIGAAFPPFAQACLSAVRAPLAGEAPNNVAARLRRRTLTGVLHVLQPLARLRGRLQQGLTPWRTRGAMQRAPLWPTKTSLWSECWQTPEQRLQSVHAALRAEGACVSLGGEHDRWDLEVRSGALGAARLLMGVEDLPGGQLVRLRLWPHVAAVGPLLSALFAALAVAALADHAWFAAATLGLFSLVGALHTIAQGTSAMATLTRALQQLRGERQ